MKMELTYKDTVNLVSPCSKMSVVDEDIDLWNSKMKGNRTTPDEIIERSVRKFAMEVQEAKRNSIAYRKWYREQVKQGQIKICGNETLERKFKTFAKAMDHFEIKHVSQYKKATENDLLEYFEELWRWKKGPPTKTDFDNFPNKKYGLSVYEDRFGRYTLFRERFSQWKKGILKREDVTRLVEPKQRKPLSDKVRYEVFKRDDFRCCFCGISAKKSDDAELEVDHIIPVSKKGTNVMSNLRTLCRSCNNGRSNRSDGSDEPK